MIYNSKTKWLMKPEDLPFRTDGGKMRKKLPYEDTNDFRQFKEGYIFVMIDFCESIEKHKNTLHARFLKFYTFDQAWRRYSSIKEKKGWFRFDYNFEPNTAYQLKCKVNYEFPSDVQILDFKKLKEDEN
jgi:hypothetical protein